MTVNEKLRALLAEARQELSRHVFTQESPACVNCGGESGFDVGRPCPYADDRELTQRIDAALADTGEREPHPEWDKTKVYDTEQMLDVRNALLEVNAPSGNTPAEQIRALYSVFLDDVSKIERKLVEAQDEVKRLKRERDEAVNDCETLVREVYALGAGASMKSLFNGRQRVAPAGSTPSPAPISDYRKSYSLMFRRAEKERDEARAEVERLKGAVRLAEGERIAESLAYVEVWCDGTKGLCAASDSAFPNGTHGHWRGGRRVELGVLLSDTYQRGAEAMREVVASCVGSDAALLQTYRSVLEGRIRALPLPEDKP